MSLDLILVLSITVLTFIMFIGQWFPADLVALLCLISLVLLGLVDPTSALEGFSNPAVITVMCMFILSEAVSKTGLLNRVGSSIVDMTGGNKTLTVLSLVLVTGISSMFINNTAAVALMIPITLQICKNTGWSASRILMPISFSSMVGGVCTLLGTSTNLIANDILRTHDETTFGMFGFFKEGLVFYGAGLLYILLFYNRLIANRRQGAGNFDSYDMKNYLTHIQIRPGSNFVGHTIDSVDDLEPELEVLYKVKSKDYYSDTIYEDDVLYVKADLQVLENLASRESVEILPSVNTLEASTNDARREIVEAVISSDSTLVSKRLSSIELLRKYSCKVLALRHSRKVLKSCLDDVRLSAGDSLLLAVPPKQIPNLRASKHFVLLNESNVTQMPRSLKTVTMASLAAMVAISALGILPIHIAALCAVVVLAISKSFTLEEAYAAVNWRVIFLLVGLLALGQAFEDSGGTRLLTETLLNGLVGSSNMLTVGSFFMITVLLTSVVTNNAAVVIMTPIAIATAHSLPGLETTQLVLTVMFASSLCFMTPIGYQTNLMIYGVGNYKFSDFLRFGFPLTLLTLAAAIVLFS